MGNVSDILRFYLKKNKTRYGKSLNFCINSLNSTFIVQLDVYFNFA